jgi:hypothetical protein
MGYIVMMKNEKETLNCLKRNLFSSFVCENYWSISLAHFFLVEKNVMEDGEKKKKKKCDLGFGVKDVRGFSTWDRSIEHVQYAVICQSLTIDFILILFWVAMERIIKWDFKPFLEKLRT